MMICDNYLDKLRLAMTLYMIFGFLPTFFLSPFAGVWADRYDRKRLIIIADAAIALATLLLAILQFSGFRHLWLLFAIPLIRALGQAVQTPAVNAFLPELVPPDRLIKANGIVSSLGSAVMLVSPMISGALLSFTSLEVILLIDVVTAAGAILVLKVLKVKPRQFGLTSEKSDYWRDLTAGIRYVRKHEFLGRFFVYITIMFTLVTPVAMLTPLQVTRSFGSDIWRLTAIEIGFSGGMLAGGLLIAIWGGFRNRVRMMASAMIILSLTTFLLGSTGNFWLYLAIMATAGLVLPYFNTPSTTLLQEKVDPVYLGRVFGVMAMISSSVMPLSMMIYGPLADIIRIEWILMTTGALKLVLAVALSFDKRLLMAGNTEMSTVKKIMDKTVMQCPAGQTKCSEQEFV